MKLTFNRSQTIEVKIQKPDSVRAFVFDLEVAVAKATEPQVDPMSGMLLNLVDVDGVLTDLRVGLPPVTSVQGLVTTCRDFLSARLRVKGCELDSLVLREKRGFWCGWKAGAFVMGHEETREWSGGVWRFSGERGFDEALLEKQVLGFGADAEAVFKANASLRSLVVENLGTGEKWSFNR